VLLTELDPLVQLKLIGGVSMTIEALDLVTESCH
jgi:hypothetical protein